MACRTCSWGTRRKVPDPTGLVRHSQITMEVDRITLKTAWKMSLYRASTIPRLP